MYKIKNGKNNNIKLVSSNGNYEAIYNKETGELVTDIRDIGTYNFIPSSAGKNPLEKIGYGIGHTGLDILPYAKWGNGPDDTTSWLGKLIGVVD